MSYTSGDLERKLEEYGYLLVEREEHEEAQVLYPKWTRFNHNEDEYLILDNAVWYSYPAERVLEANPPSERTR